MTDLSNIKGRIDSLSDKEKGRIIYIMCDTLLNSGLEGGALKDSLLFFLDMSNITADLSQE